MKKPIILIVEDKIRNMDIAYKALSSVAELRLAMDLKSALKIVRDEEIDGVITDICFHEVGISSEVYLDKESELSNSIEDTVHFGDNRMTETYEPEYWEGEGPLIPHINDPVAVSVGRISSETLARSEEVSVGYRPEFLGKTSEDLAQQVEEHCIKYNSEHPLWPRDYKYSIRLTAVPPPLGYYVIKECLEKSIPVTYISSAGHHYTSIPIPFVTGLVDYREYGENEEAFANHLSVWSDDEVVKETSKGVLARDDKKSPEMWLKCYEKLLLN